ncbi:MAG: spore cortex biosynthesis protein YabQ [Lachnospiraceae bacterium]|jgi:spore cortex biosynthesis protein YabQ|nr:spore cortex biosynthesis protein YabQ [Lachnospiraceae bacterium]
MSEGILFELQFFSKAFMLGVLMMIAYDALRIFRRIIPHGAGAVAVEDILYWLACGVCIFRMLYVENSGAIRGFAIAAVVLGMLLYLQFTKLLKKAGKKLHNSVKKGIMNSKSP